MRVPGFVTRSVRLLVCTLAPRPDLTLLDSTPAQVVDDETAPHAAGTTRRRSLYSCDRCMTRGLGDSHGNNRCQAQEPHYPRRARPRAREVLSQRDGLLR